MNNVDFAFFCADQKGTRISKCTNMVEKLDDFDLIFIKRTSLQRLSKNKDQHPVTKYNIIGDETSTSSRSAVASETESVGESVVLSSSTASLKWRQPATTSSFRNRTKDH